MYTHEEALMPILQFLADGRERNRREVATAVADHFGLNEDDRAEMLPSQSAPTYVSRSGWGLTFLRKAGYVARPRRGIYTITDAGRAVLASGRTEIDAAFLRANSETYMAWVQECRTGRRERDDDPGQPRMPSEPAALATDELNPAEALEQAHATLRADLADEILETVKERDPAFFERLVVRLLVKMGYGGSFADAARSVGKSGDGGIDGIIKEDRLGLDAIYIQAKRIQGSVGRPAVQAFVGAITGHRASKGVFLTTGTFTREAEDYVRNLDKTVVLVDGERLAELMIEFNLGVTLEQTYEIKRIDSDFFEE
jgi:restriction system protein